MDKKQSIENNIRIVGIDTIREYENNPRNNERAVDKVAKSIQLYGFQQPIVIDREGVIVVGHTRYKAALKLKLKSVPILEARKNGKWLSEAECRAYRIIDNKTNEFAEFDDELLRAELDIAKTEFPKIDIEAIFFENVQYDFSEIDHQNERLKGNEEVDIKITIPVKYEKKVRTFLRGSAHDDTAPTYGKEILRKCKLL